MRKFSRVKEYFPNKLDIILAISSSLAFFFIISLYTIYTYSNELSNPERIMNFKDSGIVLLDRNYQPFYLYYGAKNKTYVELSNMPLNFQHAVIAMEDRDFYNHGGFSVKSIIRSTIGNIRARRFAYGGSTITQQLVKNSLLNPQKNFLRKIQEIVLAYEIETRYSKDQILGMYLNSVYFGKGAYGAGEAAQKYFGKKVEDLTLGEAAFLAGVIPTPSKFTDPQDYMSKSKNRERVVLKRMQEEGYVSQDQEKEAENQELVFNLGNDENPNKAPHFAEMVRNELVEKYGEEQVAKSGFRVRTTLDLNWQKFAESAVGAQVEKLRRSSVSNGAAVAIDPKTGEIKALVGSVDWNNKSFGKVNAAISLRQPGSSFKPIVYTTAFERQVITPATVLKDEPITYKFKYGPSYSPKNYDGKFRGMVLARRALANSLNVPTIEVGSMVGISEVISTAEIMGIRTLSNDPSKYGLAISLGAGEVKLVELAGAYATLANDGAKNDPTTILEVFDKYNQEIYAYVPRSQQIISSQTSFLISSILSDRRARAEVFGSTLNISRPAAVKTGTSQNYRDSWTIGYTPSLVVGVWVGNNDSKEMNRVAGALGAAPIWKAMMEKYLEGTLVENFNAPSGVLALRVCKNNGLVLNGKGGSAGYQEYFINGTEPKGKCVLPTPQPNIAGVNSQEQKIPDDKNKDYPAGGPSDAAQANI